MTTILEQMAQRFETYASDQIAARAHQHSLVAKEACSARAEAWRLAASDLRELAGTPAPSLGYPDQDGFLVIEDVQRGNS